ncbi:MAG: hypothetical protein RMN52_16275 [Anaerolineae bacterium]|nr:hypothetical protein [Candidatus Roseilinea sp.]MDW8451557.1 hypothetical protein [Anaerolineae bacterium]
MAKPTSNMSDERHTPRISTQCIREKANKLIAVKAVLGPISACWPEKRTRQ